MTHNDTLAALEALGISPEDFVAMSTNDKVTALNMAKELHADTEKQAAYEEEQANLQAYVDWAYTVAQCMIDVEDMAVDFVDNMLHEHSEEIAEWTACFLNPGGEYIWLDMLLNHAHEVVTARLKEAMDE